MSQSFCQFSGIACLQNIALVDVRCEALGCRQIDRGVAKLHVPNQGCHLLCRASSTLYASQKVELSSSRDDF